MSKIKSPGETAVDVEKPPDNDQENFEATKEIATTPEDAAITPEEIVTVCEEHTETTSSVAPQGSKKRRRRTKKGKPGPGRPAKRQHTEDEAPSKPFRFLDLPAELRIRIYEYAVKSGTRYFPISNFMMERQRLTGFPMKKANAVLGPGQLLHVPKLHIPFMGLAQSCAQIRREFCLKYWMTTHCIPLRNFELYRRTFHRRGNLNTTPLREDKGHLRIYLFEPDLDGRDILPLIKYNLAYPNRTIKVIHSPNLGSGYAADLQQVLDNRHPNWLLWINRFNTVRIEYIDPGHVIHIRVKYGHVGFWESSPGRFRDPQLSADLGLQDDMKEISVVWSCSYV